MKLETPCQTCTGSTRKGLLWLGGNDWVECPDCVEGLTPVVAERFTPRERLVSIPGLRSHVERVLHPSVAHLQDALWQSIG
jgi:hypothetical protein